MSVVNAAFHTIRSASRMTPNHTLPEPEWGDKTTPYEVKVVKSIIPGPFVSPWRHPIWWWKMRKLRADIKYMEEQRETIPGAKELMEEFARHEDRAFINGTGGD